MPDTDADRIMRERNRQNAEWNRKTQAEAKRQAKLVYKQYIANIDAEIKVVWKLLVELKYPLMEGVSVPDWPTGRITKAGWGIGSSEE